MGRQERNLIQSLGMPTTDKAQAREVRLRWEDWWRNTAVIPVCTT